VQTILVAIDGFATADKALDVAFDLAKQRKAKVKLLHVLLRDKEPEELLRLVDLAGVKSVLVKELESLGQAEARDRTGAEIMADPNAPRRPVPEALLRRIGEHILQRAMAKAGRRRIAAEALALGDGTPGPIIAGAATATEADTIVMGSRGLRQIDAFTFGSVSREVCRLAHCSCIAVH
jgi:nucleotide-binding universal stress UspA family protein